MIDIDREILDSIIKNVFAIESITTGEIQNRDYIKYVGRFYSEDVESAHSTLLEKLRSFQLIPLLRMEDDKPVILILQEFAKPTSKPRPGLNLLFFILTLISVLFSGAMYSLGGDETSTGSFLKDIWNNLGNGWSFALSLLAILGAHEFGHYLAGRYHKVHVTLPFFIPFPFSTFGTLGAFIQMKEMPKNRKHLLDIAIAGPLSGLVVAIPILIVGLILSEVTPLPAVLQPGQMYQIEGNSVLYLFLKFITKGQLLPSPASMDGLSPIQYWVRYFFTGNPIPLGGMDVMLHPMAWAGWAGLLVTALNLIPAGQLDGGHIFFVLFGSKGIKRLLPFILLSLVGLGFIWNGWWLWAVLIFFMGRVHAEPMDQITQLDKPRKLLGILTIIIFFLVFTPVPLSIIGM
jgi:membrane-associated protease RseP (regulator of RpoE activity)